MNHNRIFRTMGGDGASQTVTRPKLRVFRWAESDFLLPDGQIATVDIAVMTKKRWVRNEWSKEEPRMRVMMVGPFVVAYKIIMYPPGAVRQGTPCKTEGGFF